jgi:CRISPR type III-A-associated protein Csm2
MSNDRIAGQVKWFDAEKGYGFIQRKGGPDVYVNIRGVRQSGLNDLDDGQFLSFELQETEKGTRAVNLVLDTGWPADYLKDGYFEEVEGIERVKPAVVDEWAEVIALMLASGDMKAHQLRRFFSKARAIENRLKREKPFAALVTDIHTFNRDAAYAVSREVAPREFKDFIERNVEWAVQSEESFRDGFLEHFQSIVAYFVYHSRDK